MATVKKEKATKVGSRKSAETKRVVEKKQPPPPEAKNPLIAILAAINVEYRKKRSKKNGGRPTALTIRNLTDILDALRNGADQKQAALVGGISEPTFYNYINGSKTFFKLISHAESAPSMLAQKAIVNAITGKPEKLIESWDAKKGKYVKIYVPEVLPHLQAAEWWLERVEKPRFSKEADAAPTNPLLGMPKNEKEADIVARLLAKAQDYAQPPKTTARTRDKRSK